MSAAVHSAPTLAGWLLRDTVITLILLVGMAAGQAWHTAASGWPSALFLAPFSFIASYMLCYMVHEWGHYLGARVSGIDMPLAPYRSVVLGRFHIEDYNRQQYLWLSWGGELGHLVVTLAGVIAWLTWPGYLAAAAFAVGGLAFSIQALAVDQPIICRVHAGADIQATAEAGTRPELILRRTWQTWIPLALLLIAAWLL